MKPVYSDTSSYGATSSICYLFFEMQFPPKALRQLKLSLSVINIYLILEDMFQC